MLKSLLLFLTAALLAGPALAQGDEPLQSRQLKQRLRATYLHNDTAQALINLYGRRQAGGAGWILGAGLTALRVLTAPAATTNTPYGYTTQPDNSNRGAAAALVLLPITAYGVGKIVHYSNANLEKMLTAYAAGQPLPKATRRKLKPRFFAQPIVEYQSVPYQRIPVTPVK